MGQVDHQVRPPLQDEDPEEVPEAVEEEGGGKSSGGRVVPDLFHLVLKMVIIY